MEGGATSSGGTSRAAESTSTSKLFYDASSKEPLAFHLHSALPSKLKAELTHLIKTHGGKIHKRLIDLHRPFYALINPDSPQVPQYAKYVCSLPEGERGIVVPYSFVRASITAREILLPVEFQPEHPIGHEGSSAPSWAPLALTRGLHRQGQPVNQEQSNDSAGDGTLVDDDGWGGLEPVAVHLHSTIGRDDQRRLALKIAKAGGDPGSTIADARVVVADEDHAEFSRLRKQYEHSLRTYIEPVTWVARCLSKGRYFHDPIEKAPMSGRKPGADRNDFTTEDDNNLARFIAKRIPEKSEGGRTGNNLYKDLYIYPWASAHTWQSWRNRYRKKQDYFDPIIDKYVQIRQDNGDSKGEFQYSRGKKRQAPADSPPVRSRSPVSTNPEPTKRARATARAKKPRPLNDNPTTSRDASGSMTNQRNIPGSDRSAGSRRQAASSDRMRSSASGTQRVIMDSSRHEDTHTNGSGGRTTSGSQPEQARQEGDTTRNQSHQDSASNLTNPPRLPTQATETVPLMGMDVNANPLMSNVYDDSDDIHAKAKDLELSDYLGSGFTSTW
ncbi:Rap1 myb domain protein [Rhizoctonia solani 123E]|uniref:DNA-binding protein RAP1 n=1 Tax=Rhizoctonia solani 123E TaxID=1423351 RepID=A0A074ST18_9AGAM|nr:Rap1 myb domain protein [Rhizoctonia solani 123E]